MPNLKVAVIEDDPALLSMYQYKLSKSGYEVKTAIDGVLGLKLCEDFMPTVILLDLKMPNMTGEDMLEKMRSTDWGSKIKVIVLTNISKDEAPMKLRLLNVDRYIVKAHYTPRQVVGIVKEVLHS